MPQSTINQSTSGDKIILDMATGNRTYIYDYTFYAGAAVTVIVKDEAGTEFARYVFPAAGSVSVQPLGNGAPRFTAIGDFIINLSGNVSVTGHFTYSQN